jgi:hypothetical protein
MLCQVTKFQLRTRRPARELNRLYGGFLVLPDKQSANALCVGLEPPERCEFANERGVSRGTC